MGKTVNDAVKIEEWTSPNGVWDITLYDNALIFVGNGYVCDWAHYYAHNGKIAYDSEYFPPKYVKEKIARMVKKHRDVFPLETH